MRLDLHSVLPSSPKLNRSICWTFEQYYQDFEYCVRALEAYALIGLGILRNPGFGLFLYKRVHLTQTALERKQLTMDNNAPNLERHRGTVSFHSNTWEHDCVSEFRKPSLATIAPPEFLNFYIKVL